MKKHYPVIFTAVCLILISCATGDGSSIQCPADTKPADSAFCTVPLQGASWLYQLQNASPVEIADTPYDILVIDYSEDGSEEGRYTAAEMDLMHTAGREDETARTVIAYLSIGEAEDYRFYFQQSWIFGLEQQPSAAAPCWLGRTNPEWKGNYKVQYWSPDWQEIILGYLDKIIDDGFDGVYLDIIDGYEYWADSENKEGLSIPEEEAAGEMIRFVKRIAHHARTVRGKTNFYIIPQNGEGILDFDTGTVGPAADDYINTISGIGIEDLFFWETDSIDPAITAGRIGFINRVRDAGKAVLVVDYVDDQSGSQGNTVRIDTFKNSAKEEGYIPYPAAADRELSGINVP